MHKNIETIVSYLQNTNLDNYWTGFKLVAYALYDKNNVYLYNHPQLTSQSKNKPEILKWNEQFVGTTLILFAGYPTAIVDMELYDDDNQLYSLVVHELFHGYQYLMKEERYPNEVHGFSYPVLKENVEMRSQERENLYRAVLAKSQRDREVYVNTFVALREKRAGQMKEYQIYENFIETYEGPAWYVELKAYYNKSSQSYEKVIESYGNILTDYCQSSVNIRASCYSSGLFICLLLDDISPNWKKDYFNTKESLFDYFKQRVANLIIPEITSLTISKETEDIVEFVMKNKESKIEKFAAKPGFHLYIEGHMSIKYFDPMNITSLENMFLHNNFIKVDIRSREYLFQQPVVAYSNGNFRNITKLHFILNKKPYVKQDSIIIDGVGEIKGDYKEEENVLYV